MSSVFSRKMTMFTFSGCLTGDGTPLKYCTGRKQTKRSRSCRGGTLRKRRPPPPGAVRDLFCPRRLFPPPVETPPPGPPNNRAGAIAANEWKDWQVRYVQLPFVDGYFL